MLLKDNDNKTNEITKPKLLKTLTINTPLKINILINL